MVKKNKQGLKPLVLEKESPSHGEQTERGAAFASMQKDDDEQNEITRNTMSCTTWVASLKLFFQLCVS